MLPPPPNAIANVGLELLVKSMEFSGAFACCESGESFSHLSDIKGKN